MEIRAPRGTDDMLGRDARLWDRFTHAADEVFSLYGYEPIYTPLFERTSLFTRGIGEATDIVTKEMYRVAGDRTIAKIAAGEGLDDDEMLSLRPEGTASVVRSVIQHNLLPQGSSAAKLYYAGPMFRYERPQKGRYRQFHQIGVEAIGAAEPSLDAETIIMMMRFFEEVGIPASSVRLLVNSMGDDACRPAYREKVAGFLRKHEDELCEECVRRIDTNPLRTFDCKNESCRSVMEHAPKLTDELCDECSHHYRQVLDYLDAVGIEYVEEPALVRGLDYYTRTVFEAQVDTGLGSQNAIGGGGRYDKLMQIAGGKPAPGLGFALGFERMKLALEHIEPDDGNTQGQPQTTVYVATVDQDLRPVAFNITTGLRDAGIAAEMDHQARSLKSQFKHADRLDALYTVVVGPDELAEDKVILRDMETKEQKLVFVSGITDTIENMIDAWEIAMLDDE